VFLRSACAIAAAGRRHKEPPGVCSHSPTTGPLDIHRTPSNSPSASPAPNANGHAGQRKQYFGGYTDIRRDLASSQSLSSSAQEELHDNQRAVSG
jgi:hypothetical protein